MQRAVARDRSRGHRSKPPAGLRTRLAATPVAPQQRAAVRLTDDALTATLARCVHTRRIAEPLLQRSPLVYRATRIGYAPGNLAGYVEDVVRPWLEEVIEIHPEAAGTAEDQLTDLDYGNVDYSWDGIELFIEMVNAKIGQESPQFAGTVETQPRAVDYAAGWRTQPGQLTVLTGGSRTTARADLVELISKLSGTIHSTSIGTVVGGYATGKGHKRIGGLSEPSARIDRQNPVGEGTFNLQYQTGSASHAGVIFVAADPQDVVLAKLLESFDQGLMVVSPRSG